jgi:hypothetical protein
MKMQERKKGRPGDIVRTVAIGKSIVVDGSTVTAESVRGRRVTLRIRPHDVRRRSKVYPIE